MNQVIQPNLADSDINFTNFPFSPEVEEKLRVSLSFILGKDATDNSFHFIAVDGDGNLAINTSASPSTVINGATVTVTATAGTVASADSNRDKIILTNLSSNSIYIGSNNSVTVDTGIPIRAGEQFVLENFTGALFGITSSLDSDLKVNGVS